MPDYCDSSRASTLSNPAHPEHEELVEWYGLNYQPEQFDIGEVNRAFHGGWSPVGK
jgi:hypothetical protein